MQRGKNQLPSSAKLNTLGRCRSLGELKIYVTISISLLKVTNHTIRLNC
jgi:hypothetical protein